MQLPNSAKPTLAAFEATGGYVNIQSTNTTATVASWIDVVSGLPAYQPTVADQPTFKNSGLAGRPDIRFGGSAYLPFNSLAPDVGQSFTVFLIASVDTAAGTNQDLFTLSQNGSAVDGYVRLFVNSSLGAFSAQNNSGTGPATTSGGTITNAAVNLFTLIKDGNAGTISLRVNGVAAASASATGTYTFDRCTIGALNAGGSVSHNLTGEIAEFSVFGGVAETSIEAYYLYKYGLNTSSNTP